MSVEPYDILMPAINAAHTSDSLVVDVSAKLVDCPAADGMDSAGKETQWEVVARGINLQGEDIHSCGQFFTRKSDKSIP